MIDSHLITLTASFISGFLSSASILAYKKDDQYFSINDFYFIILSTAWFYFFMGIFMKDILYLIIGSVFVLISLFLLRKQYFISMSQFYKGMIPHNSVSIFLTKTHLEKNKDTISTVEKEKLQDFINYQQNTIEFMKDIL